MQSFFAPNLNVPPELQFKYLSPPHWVYLIGWLAVILALCVIMPRVSLHAKENGLKILVLTIIISEISRVVWGLYHGVFRWQDWLPLHLCSTIIFTGPLLVYTRHEKLKNLLIAFTYGVSMPAAFFALLTPDKPVYSAFCYEFFQTMYSHGAIVCMGVYLLRVMGYRPRLKEIPPLLGLLLGLLALCFAVNHLINRLDPQELYKSANYMFLTFAPRDTPLEAFASFAGKFYMVPTVALLVVVWVLLFVPWELFFWRQKKADGKTPSAKAS